MVTRQDLLAGLAAVAVAAGRATPTASAISRRFSLGERRHYRGDGPRRLFGLDQGRDRGHRRRNSSDHGECDRASADGDAGKLGLAEICRYAPILGDNQREWRLTGGDVFAAFDVEASHPSIMGAGTTVLLKSRSASAKLLRRNSTLASARSRLPIAFLLARACSTAWE